MKAGLDLKWVRSNLEETGLGIMRDAIQGSGAKHEYGHVHTGLHWEERGHPGKGSCHPPPCPRLSTGVATSGIVCPSVGVPVLEEWGGTGVGA